jgi:protocatechuate 3,4-dioxygenase beta subunit
VGLASTLQLRRAAWAMGFGSTPGVCTLEAEQEVGPYYVSNEMIRQDIHEGKAGFPLALQLLVRDSRTCKPLPHAAIDVWHCDALGLYSGYTKSNPMEGGGPPPDGPPPGFDPEHSDQHHPGDGGPGGPPPGGMEGPPLTDKLTFLRGVQFTDAAGRVSFKTVFPGFYMGRTNHIHFKVRLGGHSGVADWRHTHLAGHTSHIGQVFFPEEVTAALMKQEPYSKHAIQRTTIAEDGVYGGQHGDTSLAG